MKLSVRLAVDIATRWLSKLNVVRRFMKLNDDDYQTLIKGLDKNDIKTLDIIWNQRQKLLEFIKVFEKLEDALMPLQGDNTPTMHLVRPLLRKLQIELEIYLKADSPVLKALAQSALLALEEKTKHFYKDIHDVAVFLDPSQVPKLDDYFSDEYIGEMLQKFKKEVRKLFETNGNAPTKSWLRMADATESTTPQEAMSYLKFAAEFDAPENYNVLQ